MEKHNETTPKSLAKMQSIYENHKKHRKALGRRIKQTTARLNGASREILKRRFHFDISQLYEALAETKNKEAWALRMIHSMNVNLSTNDKGNLVHRPFEALKSFKLG